MRRRRPNLAALGVLFGALASLAVGCRGEPAEPTGAQTPSTPPQASSGVSDRSGDTGSEDGLEARPIDASEVESPPITEERLVSFLACERTVAVPLSSEPTSEEEARRRLERARSCGFESLAALEAFRARVATLRRWRLHLQAHAATDGARLQAKARLDESVASGNMSEDQRDLALSFFPRIAPPARPDLQPPLSESEEAVVLDIDLNVLAPKDVDRR